MKFIRFLLASYLVPGLALAGCTAPPLAGGVVAGSGYAGGTTLAQAAPDMAPQIRPDAAPDAPPAALPAVPGKPAARVDKDSLYRLLVAEFAGRRGKLDVAVENYLVVARRTRDPRVAERAVRIAVYARDQERGLEAARLWVDTAAESYEARQILGALLVRAEQLDEATTVLKRVAAERAAEDPEVFGRIGNMLAREKSRTSSVQVMEAVVADYADSTVAQYAFAQLLGRFGEFEKAKGVLARVRALDPAHEPAAVFQAQIFQRENKRASAIAELAAYLEQYPAANAARLTYARLLVDAKQYEDARAQFQKLAAAAPDNLDIAYALGLLLLQTNDLADAEAQFRKLAEEPERRATAWFYIAQIQESRDEREAALESYRRVDRGEHHLNAQVRAAVLIAEGGDVDAARGHLHALRGRNLQESVRIYRAEAEILVRAELFDDAMHVYDKALEEFPQDGGLLYARAMLAAKLDRITVVERDLRDILSREPDNADALNALGYTLADRTERYDEAYVLIKRAHELKPDDHYVVDSLGWVLYRLGRLDEAAKHLRRAMTLKADPEVAAHLGEVLWVAGDQEGARAVWTSALKEQPEDKRLLDVIKRFEP